MIKNEVDTSHNLFLFFFPSVCLRLKAKKSTPNALRTKEDTPILRGCGAPHHQYGVPPQGTNQSGVSLFFPYERNTEQVWMPAPVGPFFWPSPFWPLVDFF